MGIRLAFQFWLTSFDMQTTDFLLTLGATSRLKTQTL